MGKKARKNRKIKRKTKHKQKSRTIDSIMAGVLASGNSSSEYEANFQNHQNHQKQLRQLFSSYNAEDVALALSISDLWLPNISSQVKHYFALSVFISMNVDQFTQSNELNSYEKFCDFISKVYSLLPSFPMLEDYIPEPDWGDVKIASKDEFLKIFYGGSVERIPDFIAAFRLRYTAQYDALNDMTIALTLQNHIISNVDREVIGNASGIDSGHIEKPAEQFWFQCRKALLSMEDILPTNDNGISQSLVLELGDFQQPTTYSSFGDLLMEGKLLPAIMLRVNGRRLPMSLRNITNVIIDYWARKVKIDPKRLEFSISLSVAKFLSLRFEKGSVIGGPLTLMTQKYQLPYRFAAVIRDEKFHFIVILDTKSLSTLKSLEQDVYGLLASGDEWGLRNELTREGILFRNNDGRQPKPAEISFLVVLPNVSTAFQRIDIPENTNAHIMCLTDFVTVFDSLDDVNELDRFWAYVDTNKSMMRGFMLNGPADLFGSFRDSNALLVDGAIIPNLISLDPHWGSNWRYKDLAKFWIDAPPQFPDETYAWKVEPKSDGLHRLTAKRSPTLAWGTTVSDCTVYFVLHVLDQDIDQNNGRMLELFIHCIADAISQRRDLLEDLPLFGRKRIVVTCYANIKTLVTELKDENNDSKVRKPLFSDWQLHSGTNVPFLNVTVNVNIARLSSRLESAEDASFEVDCVLDGVKGLSELIGESLNSEKVSSLLATASQIPRFTVKIVDRKIDVPDFATVDIPKPEQYKIARKELAIILKNQGGEPGRYELGLAKAIIDPARDAMRAKIHTLISVLDKKTLLKLCIEQHDALSIEYKNETFRIKMSLEHEVSYNRSEAMADAHEAFIQNARNYRYLLECCLSAKNSEKSPVSTSDVVQLIAYIDWLFVLYGASDVLHHDIDVAGLEIDHIYIPQVFYSDDRENREKEFSLEMAKLKLGLDVEKKDEVSSKQEAGGDWDDLDQAFFKYLGFTLTQLTQMFWILAQWKSASGESELRLSYQAPVSAIIEMLKSNIEGLKNDGAISLINFATLDPTQIRCLLGKSIDESDVPVWEHNKRGSRYTIRPLISIDNKVLTWGADACDRAASIWVNSISNGYLPADFDWPQVKDVVRKIKADLEKQLEIRAFEVCSRATTLLYHGIDFRRKFPKEQFDDVGDFDVLAYWPETNQWVCIECKYNQPPFCLKDTRRLRDRIFGSNSQRSQISKIERRHQFMLSNSERLRELLSWPKPKSGASLQIIDVYVSRDIYWWMRNPPYEVETHFVRVDTLENWLRDQDLFSEIPN